MSNKSYDYFAAVFNPDPRVMTIKRLPGIKSQYLLNEGEKMKNKYPPNAVFQVAEESGDMITDFIDNINRVVIISQRVKEFFEKQNLTSKIVEYLPFQLKNKRGRIEKESFYYIANVLLKINCLDMEKADYYLNSKKTAVLGVHVIELDKEKIPDDAILFRLGEEPSRILLRSDFVDNLKSEGFSGLSLCQEGKKLP